MHIWQALLLCLYSLMHVSMGLYARPNCEFRSENYTLEWAYEPTSRSVVFVLKAGFAPIPSSMEEKTMLWSGVGFGDRSSVSIEGIKCIGWE